MREGRPGSRHGFIHVGRHVVERRCPAPRHIHDLSLEACFGAEKRNLRVTMKLIRGVREAGRGKGRGIERVGRMVGARVGVGDE